MHRRARISPTTSPAKVAATPIPFGPGQSTNAKYQTLIKAEDLGNQKRNICDLAFAACGTGVRTFDSIEVRMGYFPGSNATLGTEFDKNISEAVTVLNARSFAWPTTANQWNNIGTQVSFAYDPAKGPLVIEVTATGAAWINGTGSSSFWRADSHQRVFALDWTTNPPATGRADVAALKMRICTDVAFTDVYGIGCPASNNKSAKLEFSGEGKINTTLTVTLKDAVPLAPTILYVGLNDAPPFPLDLPFAAGCKLYITPTIPLSTVADMNGNRDAVFPIPNNPALVCARSYFQFIPFDAPSGVFRASNYGRLIVGR